MKPLQTKLAALLASLLVAACGGGGSADTTPAVKITSVKVFGDSLQDSGTFGFKFTVQSADNQIYPERIAANYGQTLCPAYAATGLTSFVPNPKAGCTNYAIGGGRITHTSVSPQNPLNIGVQMASSSFGAGDLVIIDGGGNDAADLVGAYLGLARGASTPFVSLLSTLLTQAEVGAALQGGAATTAQVAGKYMQALADKFYGQIKSSVLDKGAQYVVVLNVPGITNTPRFQMTLDAVAAATRAGALQQGANEATATAAGAKARADSEALFKSWIVAFNAQLATRIGADPKVALIDFYAAFNDQVAMPAQFGLSNVKTPACPIKRIGSDGLPEYDFPTCTAAALSAAPPAGVSGGADWWKTYAFSDGFHPTPYGHQLTQQLIAKALATKGWL